MTSYSFYKILVSQELRAWQTGWTAGCDLPVTEPCQSRPGHMHRTASKHYEDCPDLMSEGECKSGLTATVFSFSMTYSMYRVYFLSTLLSFRAPLYSSFPYFLFKNLYLAFSKCNTHMFLSCLVYFFVQDRKNQERTLVTPASSNNTIVFIMGRGFICYKKHLNKTLLDLSDTL